MQEKNLQNDNDISLPAKELTGEAFLNSRRQYWRNEAAKDRKMKESQINFTKAPKLVTDKPQKELTGEAYLNSRRQFWRNEIAKDPNSFRENNNKIDEKETDVSSTGTIIATIIVGCFIGALIIWLEPVMPWIIALAVIFWLKFWR